MQEIEQCRSITVQEYCIVDYGHRPNGGMFDQVGFGAELSCNGFYRVLPAIQFPEKTVFEFDRGSATGISENIDPFDLTYPYSKSDMEKQSDYKF